MRKWPLLLFALIEALLVLGGVYFEPTYCVRGWLKGEAEFDGKPTSYWRAELERWSASPLDIGDSCGGRRLMLNLYSRESSWMERWLHRWRKKEATNFYELDISGPSILNRRDEAEPVLRALLDDPSPNVRQLARIGLRLE